MELRTFIEKALLDIVGGIKDAQSSTDSGTIVPQCNLFENWVGLGVTQMQIIDFEILVRAEEGTGKEAKIGVVSGIFGAGVQGSSKSDTSHESRIKLRIPVQYPTNGTVNECTIPKSRAVH